MEFELKPNNLPEEIILKIAVASKINPNKIRRYFYYNAISVNQLCEVLKIEKGHINYMIYNAKKKPLSLVTPFSSNRSSGPLFIELNEAAMEVIFKKLKI